MAMIPRIATILVALLAAIPADAVQLTVQNGRPQNRIDPQDTDAVLGDPVEPGCYVRWPSGCTRHPMKSNNWRHDTAVEDSDLTADTCRGRSAKWNEYCGIGDTAVHFVENNLPAMERTDVRKLQAREGEPFEPGCWVKMPTGCYRHPLQHTNWSFDRDSEQTVKNCEARKHMWNRYCGIRDARARFINRPSQREMQRRANARFTTTTAKPRNLNIVDRDDPDAVLGDPVEPGCYVKMPTGCPNRPVKNHDWRHDLAAEEGAEDNQMEEVCKGRPGRWNDFCGTSDALGMFIVPNKGPDGKSLVLKFKEPTDSDFMEAVEKAEEPDAETGESVTDASHDEDGAAAGKSEREVPRHGAATAPPRSEFDGAVESMHHTTSAQEEDLRKSALFKAPKDSGFTEATKSAASARASSAAKSAAASARATTKDNDFLQAARAVDQPVKPLLAAKNVQGDAGAAAAAAKAAAAKAAAAQAAAAQAAAAQAAAQAKAVGSAVVSSASGTSPASTATAVNTVHPDDPDAVLGEPVETGCYMRMPDGCPRHPLKVTGAWRRDLGMEEDTKQDEAKCKARRAHWRSWCAKDAKVLVQALFVPEPPKVLAGQTPQDAASLRLAAEARRARRRAQAGQNRRDPLDRHYILGDPIEPGCYVKAPTGCPRHPVKSTNFRQERSAEDFSTCMWFKGQWAMYCGVDNIESRWVTATTTPAPAAGQKSVSHLQLHLLGSEEELVDDAVPSEPGCYVRMPSGCTETADETTLWRHDTWAEQQGVDERGCERRTQVWNRYCGTEDARSAFVA